MDGDGDALMAEGSGPPPQPDGQEVDVLQPVAAHIDNRPLSPWAERFGVWPQDHIDFWPNEPIRHSNAAPIHPSVQPFFYSDGLSSKGHEACSSKHEKDMLFVSDHYWLELFYGIAPWQLGSITRTLQFSNRGFVPGGHFSSLSGEAHIHRLIYYTERIQVNEDSWFPFFKKDRWFSTRANEPSLLSGDYWSVDDPKVWRELSIALELANRILNALIKDKHIFLQTLLFGKLMYWETARQQLFPDKPPAPSLGTTVLLTHSFYKERFAQLYPDTPCDMDAVLNKTEEDYRDQICLLGSQQDWTLVAVKHDTRGRESGRTYVILGNIIFLNPSPIRTLIKNNITLAERVTLVYDLANTILHELSHAMIASRAKEDNSYLNQISGVTGYEPFINFEPQSEMGYAMETAVFGGPIRSVVHNGPDDVLLAPHTVTWPFPTLAESSSLGQIIAGHPATAARMEDRLTLTPSLWYSMILSEAFWENDSIPRKSDNFFCAMEYFCSRMMIQPGVNTYRTAPIVEGNPPQENRGVAEMIANWKLREKIWNQSRAGWYDKEAAIWASSPWGIVNARREIIDFTTQMNMPVDKRDLYKCAAYAISAVEAVNWGFGLIFYIQSIENPRSWVHHAIGLLMLACLPLRPAHLTREEPPPTTIVHTLHITLTGYPVEVQNIEQIRKTEPLILECPPSRYCDPLEGTGEYVPYSKGAFDHITYLDLVKKLINYLAVNLTLVSTPWLDEIIRVEEKIRAYRTNAALAGGNDVDLDTTWAAEAWDFRIPEYDPDDVSQWSYIINGWGSVH